MRKRPQIGDVLYTKVPNGYKLYQWVFKDTRWGNLVYVFPGLYDEIPNDIEEIILQQNGFIMSMPVPKACRIGFAMIVDNYDIPASCEFPQYYLNWTITRKEGEFFVTIYDFATLRRVDSFYVMSVEELPEEYRSVNLISSIYSPGWILYLFDTDFDLHKLGSETLGEHAPKYQALYDQILEAYEKKHSTKGKAVKELID